MEDSGFIKMKNLHNRNFFFLRNTEEKLVTFSPPLTHTPVQGNKQFSLFVLSLLPCDKVTGPWTLCLVLAGQSQFR